MLFRSNPEYKTKELYLTKTEAEVDGEPFEIMLLVRAESKMLANREIRRHLFHSYPGITISSVTVYETSPSAFVTRLVATAERLRPAETEAVTARPALAAPN